MRLGEGHLGAAGRIVVVASSSRGRRRLVVASASLRLVVVAVSRNIHTGIHKSIHTGIHKSIHKCIHTGIHTGIHKSPPLSPSESSPPGPHHQSGRRAVVSSVPVSVLPESSRYPHRPYPHFLALTTMCTAGRRCSDCEGLGHEAGGSFCEGLDTAAARLQGRAAESSSDCEGTASCHPSPPLSHPPALTTSAGRRAVVSSVPASILTGILTVVVAVARRRRSSPRRREVPTNVSTTVSASVSTQVSTSGAGRRVSSVPASILTSPPGPGVW